ncbi:MAG: hypothetical protein KDC53_19165 [Saprospiraceae bacterium]|nr:hypothetical protein [Saprospiraceae bacterium]
MMKYFPLFILVFIFQFVSCAQESIPDREDQIAAATAAAPVEDREGAKVYGYDTKGNLVVLEEGTNNMVCISDDPNRPGFQTVCYHKDLEPFMSRGRALRAEGKSSQEIFDIREKEAKEGVLKMPEQPTTLHLLEGKEAFYDKESHEVKQANYRYVVYIPWATAESTGLPLKPLVAGGPWIMDPGTHRAHIMITPPPQN